MMIYLFVGVFVRLKFVNFSDKIDGRVHRLVSLVA